MGFVITYKTLFEVRLLHHYHLDKAGEGSDYVLFDLAGAAEQESMLRNYDIASFLNIAPTETCVATMRKYKCIFRMMGEKLVVAVKARFDEGLNAYTPFVPMDDGLVFSFRYRVADPYFLNYSNIPLQQGEDTVYFFQNAGESGSRTYPALSHAAPVQDVNETYDAGEILLSADLGTVLIADRITGPANTPAQTFTLDPKVGGNALRYVNRNDVLRSSGNRLNIDTGLQGRSEHVTVTITNSDGTVITPVAAIFEDTNTTVQLDFSAFEEGVYQVHLEDAASAYTEDIRFYLQKEQTPCDGIIQIRVKSDTAAFNLLNNNGTLKAGNQLRSFELRFKNRATIWRYLGHDMSTAPETGPHLLARNGFLHLSVNNDHAVAVSDLPNASVNMIRTEHPVAAPGNYNLISEIYLNS